MIINHPGRSDKQSPFLVAITLRRVALTGSVPAVLTGHNPGVAWATS